MATPTTTDPIINGLNWNNQTPVEPAPEPAPQPLETSTPLSRGFLDNLAAGPVNNPVMEVRSNNRQEALNSAIERRNENTAIASEFLLGDYSTLEEGVIASQEGNQRAQNTFLEDLDQLSYAEIVAAYGPKVAAQRYRLTNAENLLRQRERQANSDRTPIRDIYPAIIGGFATGLGSMATAATALVNDEAGIAVAQWNQNMGEWFDERKSDGFNEFQRINSIRNRLDAEDSQNQHDREILSGTNPLIAGLRQIGRDVLNTGENILQTPGQSMDLTGEGVGNLIGSAGGTGLVLKLVGKGIATAVARNIAARALNAGILGSMEGGDAYGNAALQVMGMSEDQLTEMSPEYRVLRETLDHDEAQIELAADAGLYAAALAVPVGAATGALVGRFEVSPLAALIAGKSATRDMLQTAVTQGLEETVQEGWTQAASNVGVRWSGANPEQNITEGVGEAAAMGGFGGAGMGAGARATSAVIQAPRRVANAVVQLGQDRRERVFETQNPSSDTNIPVAVDKVVETQQNIQIALEEAVAQRPTETISEQPTMPDATTQVRNELNRIFAVSENEIEGIAPNLRDLIAPANRTQTLINLANKLEDKNITPTEQSQISLLVQSMAGQMTAMSNDTFRAMAGELNPIIPQLLNELQEQYDIVLSNKRVQDIINKPVTEAQVETITRLPEDVSSLEYRQATANLVNAAQVFPAFIDPVRAREVLEHNNKGRISLSADQVKFLTMAAIVSEGVQEYRETLDQSLVGTEGAKKTRNETFITGRKKGSEFRSLVQYTEELSQAVRQNDNELARTILEDLGMFAQGQNNKLAALEKSKAEGGRQNYRARARGEWFDGNTVTYHGEQSEAFLENVRADARAIQRVYDRMIEAFPEYRTQEEDDLVVTAVPSARRTALEKIASLANRKDGKIPTKNFSREELKILRDEFGAKFTRQYVTVPETLEMYAQEQFGTTVEPTPELNPETTRKKKEKTEKTKEEKKPEPAQRSVKETLDSINDFYEQEYLDDVKEYSNNIPDDIGPSEFEVKKAYRDHLKEMDEKERKSWETLDWISNSIVDLITKPERASWRNVANDIGQNISQLIQKDDDPDSFKRSVKDFLIDVRSRYRNTFTEDAMAEIIATFESANTNQESTSKTETHRVYHDTNQEFDTTSESDDAPQDNTPKATLADLVPQTRDQFKNAYELREGGSFLLTEGDPIGKIETLIKEKVSSGVAQGIWGKFFKGIDLVMRKMNGNLYSEKGKSLLDLIGKEPEEGKNSVFDFRRGRALNLLVQDLDGNWIYHPKIHEIATMAAMDWVINDTNNSIYDPEDSEIADVFGVTEQQVTNSMRRAMKTGVGMRNATISLAQRIESFLGIQAKNDINRTDAGGITLALAAEMLSSLEKAGFIETTVMPIDGGNSVATGFKVIQVTNQNLKEAKQTLFQSGSNKLLEELSVPDAEQEYFIGKPPERPVARTQMRNPETELTARERKALRKEEEKPYYINEPFIGLMKGIGEHLWMNLLGYIATTDKSRFNKKDRESKDGKNQSIVDGFNKTMGFAARAAGNLPIYFAYGISKVGRLQQKGFGPQADKQAREAIVTTISQLDLNNPAHDDAFWLTIAQSVGIKTEKGTRAGNILAAKEFISNEDVESIAGIFYALYKEQQNNPEAELTTAERKQVELLFEKLKEDGVVKDITPKLLHAILASARYQDHKFEGEGLFTHSLSLEADGKTDGPINAIVNYLSGSFQAIQLKIMGMGGFFLNQHNKTLNSGDGADLYTHVAGLFEEALPEFRKSLSPNVALFFDVVLEFLVNTGNVTIEGDNIVIGRGLVKNPLTVSVYGSGNAGIAGKILSEVMDVVFAQMTGAIQGNNDFVDIAKQLNVLVNNEVYTEWNNGIPTYKVQTAPVKERLGKIDPVEFDLTSAQYSRLTNNIQMMFGNVLVGSINEMMGDTKKTMKMFQTVTQIQAAVAIDKFNKIVAERKAKLPNGKDLSVKEYYQIMKEIAPYGAQVFMGDQSAHMGVSERPMPSNYRKDGRAIDTAASIDESILGTLRGIQPSPAGVKAAPFMVIMTGDAQMVLRLASNGLERTLMVFDGVEMAADMIDSQSLEINKQVAEGWMLDTSADVATSFENFLREKPLVNMSDDLRSELTRILDPKGFKKGQILSGTNIQKMILGVQSNMRDTSDSIRARKEVMKETGYSVDHMASGERPYTNDVPLLLDQNGQPLADDALASTLNQKYREKLAKIKNERGISQNAEPVNKGLVRAIREAKKDLGGPPGVSTFDVKQVTKMVYKSTPKNSYQRAMMLIALKALNKSGYKFHFGTAEQLSAMSGKDISLGQTDPEGKNIYIANGTTETLLHEIIHAATIDRVFDTIMNPDGVTQEIKAAVGNLQNLMGQFMNMDFTMLDGDQAGIQAQEVIQEYLNRNTPEGNTYALNEFMAYTLSNQHLINVTKKTRLHDLVRKALNTVKRILSMKRIPDTLFENIRFNTEVLIQNPMENAYPLSEELNHLANSDPRLGNIIKDVVAKVGPYINKTPENHRDYDRAYDRSVEVLDKLKNSGFTFTPQQEYGFRMIESMMLSSMKLDNNALLAASKVFKNVLEQLEPSHFLDDPNTTDMSEITKADNKYYSVVGRYNKGKQDSFSSLVPTLIALYQVNPQFKQIVDGFEIKADTKGITNSSQFDKQITELFNKGTDILSTALYTRQYKGKPVSELMDQITRELTAIEQNTQWQITKMMTNVSENMNTKLVNLMQTNIDKAYEKFADIRQNTTGVKQVAANIASMIAALGSEKYSEPMANIATKMANSDKVPHVLRDLVGELIGTNKENEHVHDLLNKVKYRVSATRQDYLETLPYVIREKFKTPLKRKQWKQLSSIFSKGDLPSLMMRMSFDKLQDILSSGKKLADETTRIQKAIEALDPRRAAEIDQKATSLARYLITRQRTTNNLLRNADAIARLLGEKKSLNTVPQELVDLVDDLVSLKAIKLMSSEDHTLMRDLMTNEKEGMDYMMKYMSSLHVREMSKQVSDRAKLNRIKGQFDNPLSGSNDLVVAVEDDFDKLISTGYTRIGDYELSVGDGKKRAYFLSPIKGQNPYHQGVLQTVQSSIYGVDAETGYTIGQKSDRITGSRARNIAKSMRKSDALKPGNYLQPIFGNDGSIVAYELPFSAEMEARIEHSSNLAVRIGQWRGRQAEEELSNEFNSQLNNKLFDQWENEKKDRANEFVNIAQSKDPVHQHIWSVIPKSMKQELRVLYKLDEEDDNTTARKPDVMMVRKDLVNNALGYPGISVGDIFTGTNRVPNQVNETVKNAIIGVFGTKAYNWLVKGERFWQSLVTYAKTNIVIRSIMVPISNIVSNVFQGLIRGIPPRTIVKNITTKVKETNIFLKNKTKLAEIEAEYAVNQHDPVIANRLRSQYRTLLDEMRRMSIWPLIEEGEFASISDGLSEADQMYGSDKFMDRVEELVDRLPSGFKTAGKYAVVSKDTALFKFLNRSVQYGDFLAKAMVYDHVKETENLEHKQAHERIRNEFVNYNILPGRPRTYLESLGLTWFWAFKIRSVKVALDIIRKRPLTALLWSVSPVRDISFPPGMGDGVLTDNLVAKALDGGLSNTMGPGMIKHVYESNTWLRLMN